MRRLVKYLFVYPIVTIIDLIDSIIGLFYLDARINFKLRFLPAPDAVHSVRVDETDTAISYRSARGQDLFRVDDESLNVYEVVRRSAHGSPDVKMLGYRELVGVEEERQSNGKVLKKLRLKNEYTWITYREMIERVDHFANGLLSIGVRSNESIVIFAETRPEWLISAVACFKIKAPIVTLYATLGLDALAYGINQTNASFLITTGESVVKLQKIIGKCERLKNVIVIT